MSLTLSSPSRLNLPSRAVVSQPERPTPSAPDCAVDSTDLLRGQRAVDIVHNGSTYRLQATRLGKLILTK